MMRRFDRKGSSRFIIPRQTNEKLRSCWSRPARKRTMSVAGMRLHGFAYGEHWEGVPQRSLGYRLLAPPKPEPWAAEVEALARRLQAAPYPDHWPPTELFCSVRLADGERLIALARYGL